MRIVTCAAGIALALLAAACSGERAESDGQGGSASSVAAAAQPTATAPDADPAPPTASGPAGEATSALTGLLYGKPHPRPVVDADDCIRRWNAATNAAARAEVAGRVDGASLGLEYDTERRCVVMLRLVAPAAPGQQVYYVEFAAGVFATPGGASGSTAEPERSVGADGRIGGEPTVPPDVPPETALPVGTVGGVGLAETPPLPDPLVGTDDCVGRWNADANAAARAAVAGHARGAFVRLEYDGEPRCTILLALADGSGSGGVPFYVEVTPGVFRELASAGGITAPPERGVDEQGRVGPLRPGGPPPAVIEGVATFGVGTHCWVDRGCVDMAAPTCGDGRTPRALVEAGTPLRFELGFEPTEPPLLTIPRDADPVQVPLPAGRTIDWTVQLPPGRFPVTLSVVGDGGDVVYTACLDVEEPHPLALPGVPLSHVPGGFPGVDVTRPDHSYPDADDCARRWNGPANIATRAEAVAGGAPAAALVSEAIGDTPWCVVLVSYPGTPRETVRAYVEARDGGAFARSGDGWGLRTAPGWLVGDDGRLTPVSLPAQLGIASDDGLVTAGAGAGACGDGRTPWLSAPSGGVVQLSLYEAPQAAPVVTVRRAGAPVSTATLDRADTVLWRPALEPGWYDVELAVQPAGGAPATYGVCLAVRP